MRSSKKGISTNQLHRTLRISLKVGVVSVALYARRDDQLGHGNQGCAWRYRS